MHVSVEHLNGLNGGQKGHALLLLIPLTFPHPQIMNRSTNPYVIKVLFAKGMEIVEGDSGAFLKLLY